MLVEGMGLRLGGKRCIGGHFPPLGGNRGLRHAGNWASSGVVVFPYSPVLRVLVSRIRHHPTERVAAPTIQTSTFLRLLTSGDHHPGDRQPFQDGWRRWCGQRHPQMNLFALPVPALRCWASRPRWSAPAQTPPPSWRG